MEIREERWPVDEDELVLGGSGYRRIAVDGRESLRVICFGSVSLILVGEVRELELDVSGSCLVDARRLKTERALVEISGSASVRVNAEHELRLWACGSSQVRQYGAGEIVRSKLEGSARVTRW